MTEQVPDGPSKDECRIWLNLHQRVDDHAGLYMSILPAAKRREHIQRARELGEEAAAEVIEAKAQVAWKKWWKSGWPWRAKESQLRMLKRKRRRTG